MVEKSHTAASEQSSWWPAMTTPFREMGEKIGDFFAPRADATADGDRYEITIELPGVDAENVDVSIHENVVTVKGEKQSEQTKEGKTYFFSERSYGAFHRSFRLPADIDPESVKAGFKDGVLTLSIPKVAPLPEKARKIEISKD